MFFRSKLFLQWKIKKWRTLINSACSYKYKLKYDLSKYDSRAWRSKAPLNLDKEENCCSNQDCSRCDFLNFWRYRIRVIMRRARFERDFSLIMNKLERELRFLLGKYLQVDYARKTQTWIGLEKIGRAYTRRFIFRIGF